MAGQVHALQREAGTMPSASSAMMAMSLWVLNGNLRAAVCSFALLQTRTFSVHRICTSSSG